MKTLLLTGLFLSSTLYQPTKLQLIEEALDRVLMTHSVNYERGNKMEGKLADVTYSYTGNTVIDARKDSLFYLVYGTYTFSKHTYVQTPNPFNGGMTGKSYNNSGSRSYVAKVKEVLDDYRVQEILVIEEPEKFDFEKAVYDSLKLTHDWIYPGAVYQD